jgi:8-oxo-dGTP pyrophosphatase MutT (NUDIX family)
VSISDYLKRLREKVGHDLLVVPSVTAAVFDEAGRVLMVKHSDRRLWVLPGGSIDPGETPADAVVRETWEETNLRAEITALIGVFSGPEFLVKYENGDEVIYVMSVFECRVVGGKPKPDGEETLEVRYFTQDETINLPVPAWARIVLPSVFKHEMEASLYSTWKPPRED